MIFYMFFIYLNWFMFKFYSFQVRTQLVILFLHRLRLGLNYYASIIFINRSNRSSDIIFSHFLTRGRSVLYTVGKCCYV